MLGKVIRGSYPSFRILSSHGEKLQKLPQPQSTLTILHGATGIFFVKHNLSHTLLKLIERYSVILRIKLQPPWPTSFRNACSSIPCSTTLLSLPTTTAQLSHASSHLHGFVHVNSSCQKVLHTLPSPSFLYLVKFHSFFEMNVSL